MTPTTEDIIGIIIEVAAVLLIHIDRNQVVAIIPNINLCVNHMDYLQ